MGSVATELHESHPAASAVSNLRAELEHTTERLESIEAEMNRGFHKLGIHNGIINAKDLHSLGAHNEYKNGVWQAGQP